MKVKELIEKLKEFDGDLDVLLTFTKMTKELEEENKKLKYVIDTLEEENKKLKYVIDTLMEKTNIDHITLASGEMFVNPSKRLRLSDDFEKCGK